MSQLFDQIVCQSGKVSYVERRKAKKCAKRIKSVGKGNRDNPKPTILRPYRCRHCGYWHLTSQGPQRL